MAGFERYAWCVFKLSDVPSLNLCARLAAGGQTNGWCREGYWVSPPSALPSIACRQLGPREKGGGGTACEEVRHRESTKTTGVQSTTVVPTQAPAMNSMGEAAKAVYGRMVKTGPMRCSASLGAV